MCRPRVETLMSVITFESLLLRRMSLVLLLLTSYTVDTGLGFGHDRPLKEPLEKITSKI